MKHLTEAERAYRRGALQAIQLLSAYSRATEISLAELLVLYEQQLMARRDDLRPVYLGQYMDVVSNEVHRIVAERVKK